MPISKMNQRIPTNHRKLKTEQFDVRLHMVDEELLELHGFGYQSNMRESFKKLIERHPILA